MFRGTHYKNSSDKTMIDDQFTLKCDQCDEQIIGEPFYSNFISGDDDSVCYDICSPECLLKFIADKLFDILKERSTR